MSQLLYFTNLTKDFMLCQIYISFTHLFGDCCYIFYSVERVEDIIARYEYIFAKLIVNKLFLKMN